MSVYVKELLFNIHVSHARIQPTVRTFRNNIVDERDPLLFMSATKEYFERLRVRLREVLFILFLQCLRLISRFVLQSYRKCLDRLASPLNL